MGVRDQLRIDVRHEADRVILALDGELDMATAELLQQATAGMDGEDETLVVLDLQQLRFIDSTGLRSVLSVLEYCRGRGQEFAVTPGSQQVQRLLSVTGVAEHLRTLATADAMVT
jgi:anti-sigma B factor antagonist